MNETEKVAEEKVKVETEVEAKAREMGWNPDKEGVDPGKWIGAEEYVARAPLFEKNRKLSRKVKELESSVKELKVHYSKIENIAYDELEREFQSVLVNLSSDQSLERFRVEYEKINKALKSSHEQEKRLLSKCRELSKDILAGATKVQSALKFSNDDSQTISYLKAELTKTYKFIELSREHE